MTEPEAQAGEKSAQKAGWIRQIYDKSLIWVQSPSGIWAPFSPFRLIYS
jgi:hypothetical protein